MEQKRKQITENREGGTGRGVKRAFIVVESASITDEVSAKSQKPHLNQRQCLIWAEVLILEISYKFNISIFGMCFMCFCSQCHSKPVIGMYFAQV